MMALKIEFLAGRFHATPWDRSVNEGEVEWPPSPWRLLRAIVAGWHHEGAEDVGTLRTILDRLASPPRFLLPPWSASHTRHFMPQGSLKGNELERSLVLDAFVAFAPNVSTAYAIWDDVSLSQPETVLLDRACSLVGYLGRAESWCEVRIATSIPERDPDLIGVDLASRSESAKNPVRRLGIAADVRGVGLLRALSVTTEEMRRNRRLIPNGATWLEYGLPYAAPSPRNDDNFEPHSPMPAHVERFILEGPSAGLRPSITDAIVVAELMRAAAMKMYSQLWDHKPAPPILSGKTERGGPAVAHKHAYFLPRDLDNDGKIDHIDVHLPQAYSHHVHRALLSVNRLWARRLGLPLDQQYLVTNLGQADRPKARTWVSTTPFVMERHPHRNRDHAIDQIRRSLRHHGFSDDVEIEPLFEPLRHRGGNRTRFDAFRRVRKEDRGVLPAFAARLTFGHAQEGPMALGRYAHFGLGQFVPYE